MYPGLYLTCTSRFINKQISAYACMQHNLWWKGLGLGLCLTFVWLYIDQLESEIRSACDIVHDSCEICFECEFRSNGTSDSTGTSCRAALKSACLWNQVRIGYLTRLEHHAGQLWNLFGCEIKVRIEHLTRLKHHAGQL